MITIHYDYTDGTELSYIEGIAKGDDFTTNCLTFFNFTYIRQGVTIVDKAGNKMSISELLGESEYTDKYITEAHNITKILIACGFDWQHKEDST